MVLRLSCQLRMAFESLSPLASFRARPWATGSAKHWICRGAPMMLKWSEYMHDGGLSWLCKLCFLMVLLPYIIDVKF